MERALCQENVLHAVRNPLGKSELAQQPEQAISCDTLHAVLRVAEARLRERNADGVPCNCTLYASDLRCSHFALCTLVQELTPGSPNKNK